MNEIECVRARLFAFAVPVLTYVRVLVYDSGAVTMIRCARDPPQSIYYVEHIYSIIQFAITPPYSTATILSC